MKNSNKKGFTLVELVVVIAIIGVLAAILVPSMMGYVKKARLKTANGNAKTGYNAAADYFTEQETLGLLATASEQGAANAAATQLASNGNGAGKIYIHCNSTPDTWGDEMDYEAFWIAQTGDDIIGRYPNPGVKIKDGKAATADDTKIEATAGTEGAAS